jgi:hypothetical protein
VSPRELAAPANGQPEGEGDEERSVLHRGGAADAVAEEEGARGLVEDNPKKVEVLLKWEGHFLLVLGVEPLFNH